METENKNPIGAQLKNSNARKDPSAKVSEQITLYLTKSGKEKLQTNARERDISPSRYVNLMLDVI